MKIILKYKIIAISAIFVLFAISILNSCKSTNVVTSKSGAELWGENCIRCHNAPSPSIYSDEQWDAAVQHMRYKANLTDTEANKIVAFLKSAN